METVLHIGIRYSSWHEVGVVLEHEEGLGSSVVVMVFVTVSTTSTSFVTMVVMVVVVVVIAPKMCCALCASDITFCE